MGALKFRLVPPDLSQTAPHLRRAYVTGMDRTPSRTSVDLRPGLLSCVRESSESGRVHVPWQVNGFGRPILSTATLAERPAPYLLPVELARGKLNDVQNQMADWSQAGLAVPSEVQQLLGRARKACARAVTSRDREEEAIASAALSLEASSAAARKLVQSYTDQLLKRRLEHSSPLPTQLLCGMDGVTKAAGWASALPSIFQGGQIRMNWGAIVPDEGKRRWEDPDAQIQWCRKHGMLASAGPLIDLRKGALPDWLWLWDGDYDEIQSQATDFVRQAITRYRGKVASWHLVHRQASRDILGLSEEEQIRLTAHLIQVAKRLDPDTPLICDFDRPWGEWMAGSRYQLGPLHLADSLARAELGLSGIGLEVAPGYQPSGSHLRDILDFSRLLDLYALVNLPIHVSFALPSASGPDPQTTGEEELDVSQWPAPPDEASQAEAVNAWVALAVAKPFVRSVTWLQTSDAPSHLFPHAGLIRPDGTFKPAFQRWKDFRERISSAPRR